MTMLVKTATLILSKLDYFNALYAADCATPQAAALSLFTRLMDAEKTSMLNSRWLILYFYLLSTGFSLTV